MLGDDHESNGNIYTVIAHVFTRMKDYENAINYLSQVWELYEAKFGKASEPVGRIYVELAKVYLKKKDFNEAINIQKKALGVY